MEEVRRQNVEGEAVIRAGAIGGLPGLPHSVAPRSHGRLHQENDRQTLHALCRWCVLLFAIMLAGCGEPQHTAHSEPHSEPQYTAHSYVAIVSPPFADVKLPSAKELFETQKQILTKQCVIFAAIEKPNVRELKIADQKDFGVWVVEHLKVEYLSQWQLIHVTFTGSDPAETAVVLGSVVDAYLAQVEKEHRAKLQAEITPLTKAYEEVEKVVRRKRTQFKKIAIQLDKTDWPVWWETPPPEDSPHAKAFAEAKSLRAEIDELNEALMRLADKRERAKVSLRVGPPVRRVQEALEPAGPDSKRPKPDKKGKHTATGQLKLSFSPHRYLFSLRRYLPHDPGDGDKLAAFKQAQKETIVSPLEIGRVLKEPTILNLKTIKGKNDPFRWLLEDVDVRFPNDDLIMEVSLSGDDPKEIALIVEVVMGNHLILALLNAEQREHILKELKRVLAEKANEVSHKFRELEELIAVKQSGELNLRQARENEAEIEIVRDETKMLKEILTGIDKELKKLEAVARAGPAAVLHEPVTTRKN